MRLRLTAWTRGLAALLPPQPYGPVGTAAAWSAVPKRRSRSRTALAAEVLFLRKQLAYYRDHEIRPRCLTDAARLSLVLWSRLFDWKEALMVVTPGTFLRWHRKGFKQYWRWKSLGGRPALPKGIRQLIRTHTSREGRTPDTPASRPAANLSSFRWQPHCRSLYQTPMAA